MEHEVITINTEVSTSELACVLGITGRRVRQLAEDGQLEKMRKGRFLLCDSVQRYIASPSKEDDSDEDLRLDRARRAADVDLKKSKAQIAELEAQELRGKMHRSEDVASMTEDLIFTIREMLLALPGRLAVDVSAADSTAEAAEMIRREIFAVMRELADYRYDPKKYEERVRTRHKWEIRNEGETDDE